VADPSRFAVAPGALPGRVEGALALPPRHADLLTSDEGPPRLSEHAAVAANLHRGVSRVGDVEDPANPRGDLWSRTPSRLDAVVLRGRVPLPGARLRWWRARAAPGLLDGKTQGVAADRPPDGEAETDTRGRATVAGDYLGRDRSRADRSRWMLVEVEAAGGERRFDVVYALDLRLAYARGEKYGATLVLRFEDLLVPVGPRPEGR
jgi:hypothetical protein